MPGKNLIALALATALLAACQNGAEEVRIGFIGPLTGDAVSYGNDTLHGTQIAVDEWNEKGGIHGKRIRLIVEDGKCNPIDATNAATKLIHTDKVIGILGGNCSTETLAAAPVAEDAKIVLLATASSSKDITNAGDFVFRVWPSNEKAAKTVYTKYFINNSIQKLAVLSELTDYCKSLHDSVISTLPSQVEIVFDEHVDAGTKDFRTLLTRLKSTEHDVLFINMQGDATIAAAIQQMRELGLETPVLSNEISESNTLSEIAGKELDGTKLISAARPNESRNPGKSFVLSFSKRFGHPNQSITFPALAYDAATILFTAIQEVGDDGEAIRDYLYSLPRHQGTVGDISFDENGDVLGVPYSTKQWKGGKLEELEVISLE